MKCAFPEAKIAAPIETAKRNLLKSVKGFEKVRFTKFRVPVAGSSTPLLHGQHMACWLGPSWRY